MQAYRKKLVLWLTASLEGLKRPPLWSGFIAGAGVSLILLWFLLVVLPNRNVPLIVNENTKRRADLINSNRENVLKVIQTIAGLGFIGTAYLAWRNSQLTEDKNVTDRFAKAVEMLANEKLEMRLGGIYSLERIARDSKEDHSVVMEILTAFIREKAARAPEPDPMSFAYDPGLYDEYDNYDDDYEPNPPKQDIQSALTVIRRRNVSSDGNQLQINLCGTNLDEADLSGINLQRAKIRSVSLRFTLLPKAMLNNSDLKWARLRDAQLQGASLTYAKLDHANLTYADLSNANLREASLKNANLTCADLHSADLGDIKWNENTDWDNVKGLDTARNIPEQLKRKLGLTSLKSEEA